MLGVEIAQQQQPLCGSQMSFQVAQRLSELCIYM